MKFLCDEGVEAQVVRQLRAAGHEVSYVAEMNPGLTDDEVLASAYRAGAVLVTGDKDFGELVFRQRRATFGVILLRLGGTGEQAVTRRTALLSPSDHSSVPRRLRD